MNPSTQRPLAQELRQSCSLMGNSGWQPMLAVHLIFMLSAAVVLTPLTTFLVRFVVSFSGQKALSDTEIAAFLLSPAGAVAGVLLLAIGLTY